MATLNTLLNRGESPVCKFSSQTTFSAIDEIKSAVLDYFFIGTTINAACEKNSALIWLQNL